MRSDDKMHIEEVTAWADDVLGPFAFKYHVEDHVFRREIVRVALEGSDAHFEISRERWTDLPDALDHKNLESALRQWALEHR